MKIKKQKIFTFFLLGARALSINRVILWSIFLVFSHCQASAILF
jgi:hypothetical protein